MDALRTLLVATTLIAGAPPLGIRWPGAPPTAPVAPPRFADVDAIVGAEIKRLRRQARNVRREG